MKYLLFFIVTTLFFNPEKVENNLSEQEIKDLVNTHNKWRSEVSVPDIEWSNELSKAAMGWAKKLKQKRCAFEHSSIGYGENLFMGTVGYYDAIYVVNAWGSEKEDYNYSDNSCDKGKVCGHYTQMVWKNSTKVGCAKIECDGNVIWVCEYDPPGNYVGRKPY